MKTSKKIVADKEIEIYHANAITSGYGHKKITVELQYNGKYQKFTAITNNMFAYDEANELDGEDKYQAFYDIIENQIIDEITEWLENL